jgi:hypothetical protein
MQFLGPWVKNDAKDRCQEERTGHTPHRRDGSAHGVQGLLDFQRPSASRSQLCLLDSSTLYPVLLRSFTCRRRHSTGPHQQARYSTLMRPCSAGICTCCHNTVPYRTPCTVSIWSAVCLLSGPRGVVLLGSHGTDTHRLSAPAYHNHNRIGALPLRPPRCFTDADLLYPRSTALCRLGNILGLSKNTPRRRHQIGRRRWHVMP